MEDIINIRNGTDVVINEDGGTNNFRVETDETSVFVVDSRSDDVGIGTATPNGHNSPNGQNLFFTHLVKL